MQRSDFTACFTKILVVVVVVVVVVVGRLIYQSSGVSSVTCIYTFNILKSVKWMETMTFF